MMFISTAEKAGSMNKTLNYIGIIIREVLALVVLICYFKRLEKYMHIYAIK
jgi:hypothetical protein